ncbi:unnamed protein product [Prorocentrum cordatum]|uniref:Uncharacterized protein n=1 Tax=Prorocentrum cordatum TaxID=2364126 RepID=A0ABN9QH10_9DINO|nr:unnamed protein product [Polarella glacialis]CAK0824767.1 unnamed protein product [Polarella glacialis]|mmetsp:Transcript_62156/g.161537  ORF Transcript_62156/g.161537 Transcript_62156/m.161537 type:complete len:333 (+) Transcript_62156:85-1083(+)
MGHHPSKHEQVQLVVQYAPPSEKVDEEEKSIEAEKRQFQKVLKWSEKTNKRMLDQKSWQTEICQNLPDKICRCNISWQAKERFVEFLPWMIFFTVSAVIGLCICARAVLVSHMSNTTPMSNAISGPYRLAIMWVLLLLDAMLMLSLMGTWKLFQTLMADLKDLEEKVPDAILKFRNEVSNLNKASQKDFLIAARFLTNLFNRLVHVESKINETMTTVNSNMNSKAARCFCGSLVRKWDSADDAFVGKAQPIFSKVFTDIELAEHVIDAEEDLLGKVLTYEEKTIIPMEKLVALHVISVIEKDAYLAFRIIIACWSILVFWTTAHILNVEFRG